MPAVLSAIQRIQSAFLPDDLQIFHAVFAADPGFKNVYIPFFLMMPSSAEKNPAFSQNKKQVRKNYTVFKIVRPDGSVTEQLVA